MKYLPVFLILLFSAFISNAQMRLVPGTVSVFEDLTVKNVVVEAKHSGANAISDSLGQFSILCESTDVVKFKSKVFKVKRIKVEPNTDSLNVNLSFKDSPEVVKKAVENGYITSSDASMAKSNLAKSDIDFCKYNDIYDLIQGRYSGVQVMNNKDILIRGHTSVSGNNPALLVVDGRIVSSLSFLSPCDVKSIDISKNGAGTVYTSQGASGVVLIETKKSTD